MNLCPYCHFWKKPSPRGARSEACPNCVQPRGATTQELERKIQGLDALGYAGAIALAPLLIMMASYPGYALGVLPALGLIFWSINKSAQLKSQMDSPSKHSLPEELAKQKAPLQARIQELARLRQEELKDGQHDDADRLQTRVSLLTKAMDSLGRALYKIETREKGYHIALWLNKLEHCIWDFRQLKTLTSKNFQDLIARVMMLRKVGVLQATLSPAHQQADSPLAGASEAIAEGLTKLSRLEQYLRDRRVLEAVGGAAVPAPDFLQAETQPTWSLSLIPNQSLDDLEGVDQEALHEIKGLLRVGAES